MLVIGLLLIGCKPKEVPIEPEEPEEVQPTVEPEEPIQKEPKKEPDKEEFVRPRLNANITPARDLTGNWEGSLTFTNNCPNPACLYKGRMNPPSVTMELKQNGNNVIGNVTVNFGSFEIEGQNCATFQVLVNQGIQSISVVNNGVISSSKFTFTDVGGNFWELGLTTDLLQGTISSKVPGCMGIKSDKVKLSRK